MKVNVYDTFGEQICSQFTSKVDKKFLDRYGRVDSLV